MNETEFKNWTQVTQSSETKWVQDPIRWHNHNEIFAYKGGEDGVWVSIDMNGLATAGTYEGAVPHISESLFKQTFSKQFEDQSEGFACAK